MKTVAFPLLCLLAVLAASPAWSQAAPQPPFSKGVNLTQWLEQPSVRSIQFTRFDKSDFQFLKALGADVVRLPIKLHDMTSGAPDYRIDPLFFQFLDRIVDWAEELGIHLIIDNHSFDSSRPTEANIEQILLKVWPQVAAHYKNRSDLILYEVLNEPHGIDPLAWGAIQGRVVQAIRAVDPRHAIVVGGADWNSYRELDRLPAYPDPNLIYTFHFYDPFLFTHQGAEWTDQKSIAGIPFPPDPARMPSRAGLNLGNWQAKVFDNYQRDGSPQAVEALLDIPARFAAKRQVRVFCGEYGAYMRVCPPADRVRWYEFARTALEKRNIAWTSWDYSGGFGLFEGPNDSDFSSRINLPLVRAMGFAEPPQGAPAAGPETAPLEIYADYSPRGIRSGVWGDAAYADYYCQDRPAAGQFCIRLAKPARYQAAAFAFDRPRDLSRIREQGGAVELKLRSAGQPGKLELRLVGAEDGAALPWRNAAPVELAGSGGWQTLRIPLADLRETGAWKGKWFPGKGLFDWKSVAKLEIVAEFADLKQSEVWLDDIRIVP